MTISIEEYDRNERAALATVGYAQHAAYSTKTFKDHGFPTNMTEESELFKYIDSVLGFDLERLDAGYFFRATPIRTDYSLDEMTLLNKISKGVEDITEKSCGKKHSVLLNHLSATGLFRIVQAISQYSDKESLSVFEVGPGCGYAGVMIGMLGHTYSSYDVTQAYYLYQNRLMDHFFGEEFTEYAGDKEYGPDMASLSRITHLPWWKYMDLYKANPFKADVIISNANLAEMHPLSMKYLARLSKMMLEGSDIGLFVFADVGSQHMGSQGDIFHHLAEAGFDVLMQEQFFGFAPKGQKISPDLIAQLEKDIPNYDTTGLGKSFGARDFIKFDEDKLSEEFKFHAFLSDWPEL